MDVLDPYIQNISRNSRIKSLLGLATIPIFGFKIDPITTVVC